MIVFKVIFKLLNSNYLNQKLNIYFAKNDLQLINLRKE